MENKYQVIYADPPWSYGSKELYGDKKGNGKRENRFRDIERIYNTMSIEDLKQLPIRDISDKNCALFMWVTSSHLVEGIELIKAWGFKYKTIAFVWAKTYNTGVFATTMGPHTLPSTEICLLAIKGSMKEYKKSNNVRQLVIAERTNHSKKPEEVALRIESLYPETNKLEMFARKQRKNWDVFGNEVENTITLNQH